MKIKDQLRVLFLILLAALHAAPAQASFPVALRGSGDQKVVDLVTAPSGAAFVTGTFSGNISVGSELIGSQGLDDAFVAKISALGDLVWLKTVGGTSIDRGLALALDAADNVYVAGEYFDEITVGDTFPIVTLEESGDQNGDIFIAKFRGSDGELQWAARASGIGNDTVGGLAFVPGDPDVFPPLPARLVLGGSYQCDLRFFDEDGAESSHATRIGSTSGGCGDDLSGRRLPIVAVVDVSGSWVSRYRRFSTVDDDPEDPVGARIAGMVAYYGAGAGSSPEIYAYGQMRDEVEFDFWDSASATFDNRVLGSMGDLVGFWKRVTSRQASGNGSAHSDPEDSDGDTQTVRTPALPIGSEDTVVVEWQHSYSFFDPTLIDVINGGRAAGGSFSYSTTNTSDDWTVLDENFFEEGAPELHSIPLAADDNVRWYGKNLSEPGFDQVRTREIVGSDLGANGTIYFRWWHTYGRARGVLGPGSIRSGDGWWIDNLVIKKNGEVIAEYNFDSINEERGFIAKVNNNLQNWDWAVRVPRYSELRDVAVDKNGDLVLVGDKLDGGTSVFPLEGGDISLPARRGAFVAELRDAGHDAVWDWATSTVGGTGRAVHSDGEGATFLTGSFVDTFQREVGAPQLTSTGDDDIYVARLDTEGTWFPGSSDSLWGDGRSAVCAGGGGDDTANAISVGGVRDDGSRPIYVAGAYSGWLGSGCGRIEPNDNDLVALDGLEALVAELDDNGRFTEPPAAVETVVGETVLPPLGAELTEAAFVPEFFDENGSPINALDNYFKWSPPEANGGTAQLLAVRALPDDEADPDGVEPDTIEIRWRVAGQPLESDRRISTISRLVWPDRRCDPDIGITDSCFQLHVAGAPVDILPDGGVPERAYLGLHTAAGSDAEVTNGTVFNASAEDFSTIVYVEGPAPDVTALPLDLRVVRTVEAYNPSPDGGTAHLLRGAACTIGTEIAPDPADHDQDGRAGYVLNEKAFFDGVGSQSPYDREARLGRIIPVNRVNPSRPQDLDRAMTVAWYKRNDINVAWPQKAVEYTCRWPASPEQIIIASEQGSEVLDQPPLDPGLFPQLHIYQQGDSSLAGYNPNDEHALFAPSNLENGFAAIYALRADFGGSIDPSSASDPHVIAKYFDEASESWAYRIYRVDPIGGGFETFEFTGVAGATVNPPYPLRLQAPCEESRILGEVEGAPQPPIPFFRDTNAQLWARAAGDGKVHYHYPLQADWFVDLDHNDEMDDLNGDGTLGNEAGVCIPWMPRLPVGQGGTADLRAPIEVAYSISWPADVPRLTVGETLLKPKRGLPDIFNQAAVQIVFDEHSASNPLEPAQTLAQIFDPLNPRSAALDELPSGTQALATSLDETGKTVINGNAAGDKRLPFALYERLRWDPSTQKLSFSGLFDESGAGEPLLLPNVMTVDERGQLLAISDDPSWQDAVQEIFERSRNPNGVQRICTSSSVVDGMLHCDKDADRPIDPSSDVLIGVADTNDDGILEPIRAEGVNAGLTAGAAQSTGYVTLAFNDSENLALPVSLEVIRVDCLVAPEPPAPPTLVSPYIGQVHVIGAGNVFDEQVTLRHSGDFGGRVEELEFQWFVHPDVDGTPPEAPSNIDGGILNGWSEIPISDPRGAVQVTLGGADIRTLSDNWYLARYRGLPVCNNDADYTVVAGQPGSTPNDPRAQLSPGWVKRVVAGLNPFDARVSAFHKSPANTFASMISQLGERYEGPIAFSDDPDNLNEIGLIEAYETVFRRARELSIDATPTVNYEPANAALLNIASRISDFYMLLGNEAYADAQDPTIGISTSSVEFGFGSLAPTIFNFQNQSASLLEEELILLRGRDDSQAPTAAPPVYNRYFWNFTQGDGEVAYALSYNISDQNSDGFLNESDARIQFPQGHGDAWGHYLTAAKIFYGLLRHSSYSWNPRPEAVVVAGTPLQVDFLDERKFAKAAAARARAGAEIVDLTYRSEYVEDPGGQWQGYKDTDPQRAWGLAGWGRRAGQGAYLDWVVGNSILPDEDPIPEHVGIQKIDRMTVDELSEISAAYIEIQSQIDEADQGLNPLGLAKGVVPFDIDPALVDAGEAHFEQVFERAIAALDNAVEIWDFANQLGRMLRFNQDEVDDLVGNTLDRERDFKSRLIEIYGRPYDDDLGPGGTYPSDYDGPDLYHYNYIDLPAMEGTPFDISDIPSRVGRLREFTVEFAPLPRGVGSVGILTAICAASPMAPGCPLGPPAEGKVEVDYVNWDLPTRPGYAEVKPESWSGERPAAGKIQESLSELMNAQISLRQALNEYEKLRQTVDGAAKKIKTIFKRRSEDLVLENHKNLLVRGLNAAIKAMEKKSAAIRKSAKSVDTTFKNKADCIPKNLVAGTSSGGDVSSSQRCAVKISGKKLATGLDTAADGIGQAKSALGYAKDELSTQVAIRLKVRGIESELNGLRAKVTALMREEPILRTEAFARAQVVEQAKQNYRNALAEGVRVLEQLVAFRKTTAAATQDYRHEDMAFRVFRNEALQKYRAAFDMAARFAYLAATAYDYDTNLLGSEGNSGRQFLTNIVRQRSLGQLLGGEPVPGSPGLADPLGRMAANFSVLKTQMGFNNPQIETNRFSLRSGLFRFSDEAEADADWRTELIRYRVEDLWEVPEFRRFARPFTEEALGPQPGLVIPFDTTVTFGLNFFGWPLAAGDAAYDPSQFSTRVRSAGVWFDGYGSLPLSQTPRVYLIPTGADILRPPTSGEFTTREWSVVDQLIPVPFALGGDDLEDPDWMPQDTLSGSFIEARRFGSFRAYDYDPNAQFGDETSSDNRLIGRSVWNSRWLLIIPGGTLLFDPEEGIDTLIGSDTTPGIRDIKIFFKTYAYQGF